MNALSLGLTRFTENIEGDRKDHSLSSHELREEVSRLSLQLQQIQEREARYLSLMEDSSNPICFFDAAGIITFANASFCNFFWLEKTQVLGTDFFQLLPEKKQWKFRREFESLTPDNPFMCSAPQLYGAKGIKCWETWNIRANFDESGKVQNYQILGQDVTAVKESEELNSSVNSIFENAPLGFSYCKDLTVNRVNPALCNMLGYREEELLKKTIPFKDLYFEINGNDSQCLKERLKLDKSSFCETRLRRKDGTVLDAFVLAVPVNLTTGQRDHFFLVQDISEHKELEKQLLRTDLVISRSSLVLFQGQFVKGIPLDYVSDNISQFGYKSRDLTISRTSLNSLIHPADLPLTLALAEKDNRTGKLDREYTYRLRRTTGQYRWVNQKSRIIPSKDGKPDTLVGILMDVTDQKEAEKALNENHQQLELQVARLEKTWEQTIGLLAAVTELRDPYTMGHQRRVANLSGTIAIEMGLDEGQVQETVRAALIHDIGKIQIPNDYLSKPGKLTSKEFALIKEHPRVGAELLKKIDLPWQLAEIVAQHHERLDGSGYPEGLTCEEILLPARILAVADVVEAMASHRPYRPALGLDKALDEITSKAGKLYDPEAVAACRNLFLEKGYRWFEG